MSFKYEEFVLLESKMGKFLPTLTNIWEEKEL
jgi:hypothetical protein